MIGNTLKRYQPDFRYLCDDAETEGLNLFFSRPWEIAWLIADSKMIYEEEVHYPCFPDLKVSAQAALITGFNFADYKAKSEDPVKVLNRWEERIYDKSLGVLRQNGFYDGYIHATLRRLCGKDPRPDWSWYSRYWDTNCLSKAYRKEIKPDLSNMEIWHWKIQSIHEKLKTKLGVMCAEFKIPFDERESHKASYDIRKTRELFEVAKWQIEI
mgnify:CR=1 FL=1